MRYKILQGITPKIYDERPWGGASEGASFYSKAVTPNIYRGRTPQRNVMKKDLLKEVTPIPMGVRRPFIVEQVFNYFNPSEFGMGLTAVRFLSLGSLGANHMTSHPPEVIDVSLWGPLRR